MKNEALLKVIGLAGGVTKLSKQLGLSSPAISQWRLVPAGRVLAVELATGVPRHEQRPDIYPPPSTSIPDA
jgi:DNA-binding transcriptional regulator YdaS (Cro superfamily)